MEKTIGKKLYDLRKQSGFTQDYVAEKLGVSAQAVSKWENDIACPDIMTLPKIAELYGITIDELFKNEEVESNVKFEKTEQINEEDLVLRVYVDTVHGDKVKVTLPYPIVKEFVSRLTNDKKTMEYTLNLTKLHMKPHTLAADNSSIKATNRMFDEAIDPVAMASSIGLIDPNGNVIIPFENKAIKPIANDLLLVEKAKPVTESVIEAIELRADPQAASRLVTTPAVIKENMNAKMGAEGRFVFNDQFSEATICDVNGNNLVDNELYSFVGVTADKLYLSKNTAESFVSEFSLGEKKLVLTPDMGDPMLNIGSGDASEFTVDLAAVQQNAEQAALDAEAATLAAGAAAEAAMKEDEEIRAAGAEGTAPAEGGEEVATDSMDSVEVSENGATVNRKLIERVDISVQTKEPKNYTICH